VTSCFAAQAGDAPIEFGDGPLDRPPSSAVNSTSIPTEKRDKATNCRAARSGWIRSMMRRFSAISSSWVN
jgi:hypothetical protein